MQKHLFHTSIIGLLLIYSFVLCGMNAPDTKVAQTPKVPSLITYCTNSLVNRWQDPQIRKKEMPSKNNITPEVSCLLAAGLLDRNLKETVCDLIPADSYTLNRHTGWISSIDFDPENKLASASSDMTIQIWNITTQKQVGELRGHTDHVVSIEFSKDGKTLVSGSCDKSVRLWDMQKLTPVGIFPEHTGHVFATAFSPDGSHVASADKKNVKLWHLGKKKLVCTFSGHNKDICSLSFSPDGTRLASASEDKTIRIWDIENKEQASLLVGHDDQVFSVDYSPLGDTVASGSCDCTVRIWDLENKKQISTFSRKNHSPEPFIRSVAYGPYGKYLASGSNDGGVQLWDIRMCESVRNFFVQTRSGDTVRIYSVALSADGNTLASGSTAKVVNVWDLRKLNRALFILENQTNLSDLGDLEQWANNGNDPNEMPIQKLKGLME